MSPTRSPRRRGGLGPLLLSLALLPLLGLGAGSCLFGAGPAAADVLVTQDGSRIQTEGPWEVKGRQVVFTRLDGTLASIRTSEVDLEASETATAEAQEEARRHVAEEDAEDGSEGEAERRAETEDEREAAWKLTDSDFTRRRPAPVGDGDGEDGEEASEEEVRSDAPPVVLNHRREEDSFDGHLIIAGTLANRTSATATAVAVRVYLFDESGELIGEKTASVERSSLPPGQRTTFTAPFPGVYNYASLRFETSSTNLETARPEAEAEGERPDGATDDEAGQAGES